jgi:hypothetical protein
VSNRKDARRGRGPEPVSVFMVVTVAWNMYGFATGFFGRAWADAPIPVIPISYALNAALAVFSPFVRSDKGWTARIATVLGFLMTIWSSIGLLFLSREEEMAPKIPGVLGPGVAAVLGALIAALGWRRR